ncbi:hypothetical protein D3C72_2325020 [compost metagenome]
MSCPFSGGIHLLRLEQLAAKAGLDDVAVDQTRDVGKVVVPAALIHARALAQDPKVKREQPP